MNQTRKGKGFLENFRDRPVFWGFEHEGSQQVGLDWQVQNVDSRPVFWGLYLRRWDGLRGLALAQLWTTVLAALIALTTLAAWIAWAALIAWVAWIAWAAWAALIALAALAALIALAAALVALVWSENNP